jgi:hypothetical protein
VISARVAVKPSPWPTMRNGPAVVSATPIVKLAPSSRTASAIGSLCDGSMQIVLAAAAGNTGEVSTTAARAAVSAARSFAAAASSASAASDSAIKDSSTAAG